MPWHIVELTIMVLLSFTLSLANMCADCNRSLLVSAAGLPKQSEQRREHRDRRAAQKSVAPAGDAADVAPVHAGAPHPGLPASLCSYMPASPCQ